MAHFASHALLLLALLALGSSKRLQQQQDVLSPSTDLCSQRGQGTGLRTLCDRFSWWEGSATDELVDDLGMLLERDGKEAPDGPFKLPSLESCGVPSYDALEPSIDKETMKFHHDFHHQKYVDKLNEGLLEFEQYKDLKLEDILAKVKEDEKPIRNAGGGHYNHALFWSTLKKGGKDKPCGDLEKAIVKQWGSLGKFKLEFNETAEKLFGSGWVWLGVSEDGMTIQGLPNQDSPIMPADEQSLPILGIDVWEHAYYLKYQNRRPEYITAWWNVIDWGTVEKYYKIVKESGKPLPFESLCTGEIKTESMAEKETEETEEKEEKKEKEEKEASGTGDSLQSNVQAAAKGLSRLLVSNMLD